MNRWQQVLVAAAWLPIAAIITGLLVWLAVEATKAIETRIARRRGGKA